MGPAAGGGPTGVGDAVAWGAGEGPQPSGAPPTSVAGRALAGPVTIAKHTSAAAPSVGSSACCKVVRRMTFSYSYVYCNPSIYPGGRPLRQPCRGVLRWPA